MIKPLINEGQYAYVMAQIALLNCEVAGMQAENHHRMACGNSIAYGDDEFNRIFDAYNTRIGHEAFAKWEETK
jgi:hypothetical protein